MPASITYLASFERGDHVDESGTFMLRIKLQLVVYRFVNLLICLSADNLAYMDHQTLISRCDKSLTAISYNSGHHLKLVRCQVSLSPRLLCPRSTLKHVCPTLKSRAGSFRAMCQTNRSYKVHNSRGS